MSEKLRMEAYYYGFEETGCIEVDRVLSAIANAGKAYHHTSEWAQNDDREPSQIDYIQDAACGAAEKIKELESAMQEFADEVDTHEGTFPSSMELSKLFKTFGGKFKQILKPKPVKNPCIKCGKEWDDINEEKCPYCGNEIPF